MKNYSYDVEKELFDRRTATELQHKLRVTIPCYTVIEFKLIGLEDIEITRELIKIKYADKEDPIISTIENAKNFFTFKPWYIKNKIKFGGTTLTYGSYKKEDIENSKYRVTIYVY